MQWGGVRDGTRALRRVEDRGMAGKGAGVCGGVVGWIVWADAIGQAALGLK